MVKEIRNMELTPRENEVVDTIINSKCFTITEISKKLFISRATAHSHLQSVYSKKQLPRNSIAGIIWDYYNKRG